MYAPPLEVKLKGNYARFYSNNKSPSVQASTSTEARARGWQTAFIVIQPEAEVEVVDFNNLGLHPSLIFHESSVRAPCPNVDVEVAPRMILFESISYSSGGE